jgi:hypothetical protein
MAEAGEAIQTFASPADRSSFIPPPLELQVAIPTRQL